MSQEPVAIGALINGAISATLAILLFAGVDPELVGALTLAATAWVAVIGAVVRSRVTPVERAIIGRAVVPEDEDRGVATLDLLVTVLIIVILVLLLLRLA